MFFISRSRVGCCCVCWSMAFVEGVGSGLSGVVVGVGAGWIGGWCVGGGDAVVGWGRGGGGWDTLS